MLIFVGATVLAGGAAGAANAFASVGLGIADGETLPGDAAELTRLYAERFEASLSERHLQEAEVIAKQLIEHLRASSPERQVATAYALSNLALVQRLTEQYAASVQNYDAAIEIIEKDDNMLSPRLLTPLQGLARTHQASGNTGLALQTYDRALHVSHVNEGPHSLRQVDILNSMVDANVEAGRLEDAFVLLDRLDMLFERRYSLYSVELLPVLNRRAELLNMMGRHADERQVYRRIVAIMADEIGETSPTLIPAYMKLASTYLQRTDKVVYRSEPTTQTGETYLRKALEIAEGHPDTDWRVLEECLLGLGDYYMLMGAEDLARINYKRAWELTSSDATYLDHRRKHLEQPLLLRRQPLSPYADFAYGWDLDAIDPDDFVDGHVVARYTVTSRGRATDIEFESVEPENFSQMEYRVRRGIRESVFRPRFEDGEPVATERMSYRHDFRYVPADLAANR